jgi:hypothetical protein
MVIKYLFFIIILLSNFSAYSQKLPIALIIKNIDSLVFVINDQKVTLLSECDSVPYINDNYAYRCWNFYFTDNSKKEISKVTISFNGFVEWFYYYERNKVIKVQRNKLLNGESKYKWSKYVNEDKVICQKGNADKIGVDEVEGAYHFRYLALDYATHHKSH